MSQIPHISVCICTFRRGVLLRALLERLGSQRTDGAFSYSAVVVDNDAEGSAEPVIAAVREAVGYPIYYHREPDKNVARARNCAVLHSSGDFVAFIDDDETPVDEWLLRLLQTSRRLKADAVLGPVLPLYAADPPPWLIKCGFLDRPRCATGTVLSWPNTRTGNVLLSSKVFDGGRTLFRPEFRHSEDQDFFKRLAARGRVAVWCDEAEVYEIQGVDRFVISYFVKRSLLRGNVSLRLQPNKAVTIAKAMVAVGIYSVASPVCALGRSHLAALYLTKACDHLGKLLAACGIDLQPRLT